MNLTLVITQACNMACRYCYAGAKDSTAMPEEVARRALDWAMANCDGELLLAYFGGEPMLRWDLLTRYHAVASDMAKWYGIELKHTVTTNGTLLTQEKMAWLSEHDVVVGLSTDGNRVAHERMRPMGGGDSSYDAVCGGLQVALAAKPMTQTITVVHPDSVDQLSSSVESLFAAGVRVVSLSLDPSADWDLGSLGEARRQLELVGDLWLEEFRAERDCWIEPLDGRIVARIKGGLQDCDQCSAGFGELAVAPSGMWYPCERMVGSDDDEARRFALGSVHDEPQGPDAACQELFLASHREEPDECRSCPLNARCQHRCACSNVMASGHAAQPGGAQCAWEQSAIGVADRVAAALWEEGNPLFLRRRYRLEQA